ncbi:MAG: hypothetical protein LBM66_05855, partial [Bifidobacteriaceae bacterium]|nr:hypothetical protein [Bifidobacteriaceae bacterium]
AGGVTARVTTGDLRVASTSGNVELRVGTGTVRVGSAGAGVLHVTCGYGPIEVGVPAGTATFVDAGSRHGRVLNQLTAAEAPAGDAPHAEIHASTRFGDITLYRA